MKQERLLIPISSSRAADEQEVPLSPPSRRHAGWYWSILIALFFSGWGLRTVGANNIVDTDGARHAMNGAFLHDLILRGKFTDIIPYAYKYYAHLPALSMPYHPPLFPAIEAVFFFVFGVNVLAARLAIALAVAASAILLFRLVVATHGSALLAGASTITFLSLPYSLSLSSDVMLEFPAMAFALLALHFLWNGGDGYPLKNALAFGLFAAAAVWTKQQSVFLGAVPFFYLALAGQWKVFKRVPIWLSAALFGLLLLALSALSVPFHGVGINQAAPPGRLHVFYRNLVFYIEHSDWVLGPSGVVLILVFLAALAGRMLPRRSIAFYGAWAGCSLLILLLIGPYSVRYLFFALPALIVLGYVSITTIVRRFFKRGDRWAFASCLIFLVGSLLWSFPRAAVYLRGPDQVATLLARTGAHRILYCGGTDGNFIFGYRSARAGLDTAIIAGDKLPPEMFIPARFEAFARRYGIEYVVLEHSNAAEERQRAPWETLFKAGPPSMRLERTFQLTSSIARWNGTLAVYRFSNPSPHPDNDLNMKMNMIGGKMDFTLKQ